MTTATTPTQPHITQVRMALLDTLSDLRNREQPMEVDRARAVAQVAAVLIDTAKVECEYLKLTGQDNSTFLSASAGDRLPAIAHSNEPTAHKPFPVSVLHRMQG